MDQKLILALLACVLLGWWFADITASAQDLPPITPGPKKVHPKLPSVLQELFDEFSKDPNRGRAFMRERLHPKQFVDDSVRLILWPQGLKPANIPRGILKALGATVEAASPSLLQVLVPIPKLISLADQLPGVRFIQLHHPPQPLDVPSRPLTTSQGVTLTGANTYHSAGITGSGVKVAIIDLGFQNIQSAINAGEFGTPHKIDPNCTKDYTTNTTGIAAVDKFGDHGVSVAHVVHNMAPGATLCLKLIDTLVHLENAKNDAIAEGVRVINHSVGWALVNSFYDGTGFVDGIAASAFDNGILWVNAAGNEAQTHWQGGWVDTDNDGWLNFSGIDECNDVSLSAGFWYSFLMNWNAYPSDPEDYDLYLYRVNPDNTLTQVASSIRPQTGTQQPEESINYLPPTSGTYCFAFRRFSAPTAPAIELFIWPDGPGGNPQYNVASSSLGDPANGPKVMAVAAIWHQNWTAGPQEPFSSQGPTNNSKFATARVEPAISGPDGTIDYDGTNAFGTSFSSPHVAGCAALIRAANPGFTVAQTRSKLESEAIDMGAAGKDNIFGWGRLNCAFFLDPTPAVMRLVRETGDFRIDGKYFCPTFPCYNTGSADIAERIDVSEPVEPGDVVELDPTKPKHYRKARGPQSWLVAGVISAQPGFALANRPEELAMELKPVPIVNPRALLSLEEGKLSRLLWEPSREVLLLPLILSLTLGKLLHPKELGSVSIARLADLWEKRAWPAGRPLLALMGRVPVKATTENGPIRPGDLLTSSSKPGYAMRCADMKKCEGAIIGKALEALESGEGIIMILVMR